MKIILFDPVKTRQDLLPLTYTRPIADCRVGILTIRQKWEHYLGNNSYSLTEAYLEAKYPACKESGARIYINGSILPTLPMVDVIKNLKEEQVLLDGNIILAYCTAKSQINYNNIEAIAHAAQKIAFTDSYQKVNYPFDIFKLNGGAIEADFKLITVGRKSQPFSDTNTVLGDSSRLFIEEGATIECSILNTKGGVIYIGKDAEIMEGCTVRGPFALCEHSGLKMAAKIYGDTTIGPYCKVGGEVSNTVFFGYSNKGHDGFIGNSVIAEWCNIGADTNCSNLKNNYGTVEVWNYREEKYIGTGLQFHGLIVADHAKSGINTMFNTGTIVGVAANVFGGGFPDKFIPSFSWGGANEFTTFLLDKAIEVASRMMERRGIALTQADIDILTEVCKRDTKYRVA